MVGKNFQDKVSTIPGIDPIVANLHLGRLCDEASHSKSRVRGGVRDRVRVI